jgi:hypothetical protein
MPRPVIPSQTGQRERPAAHRGRHGDDERGDADRSLPQDAGIGRLVGEHVPVGVAIKHPADHLDEPDYEREGRDQDGDKEYIFHGVALRTIPA